MFKLQWLYLMALLSHWWKFLFSTELVEVPGKPPVFLNADKPVHWMDMSSIHVYGSHLHQHWCDPRTLDSDEHHRQFSDKSKRDTYFPQGEHKWYVGNHWRDYLFRPFMFHFNPLSEPRNVAYDLGYPSYRAMNASYQYLLKQTKQNVMTISKSVFRGLVGFATLTTFVLLLSYVTLTNPQQAQAQTPHPTATVVAETYLAEQIVRQNKVVEQLLLDQQKYQDSINDALRKQSRNQEKLLNKIEDLEEEIDRLQTKRQYKSTKRSRRK